MASHSSNNDQRYVTHMFPTYLLAVIPSLAGSAQFMPFRLDTSHAGGTTSQVWLFRKFCVSSIVMVLYQS
jgi:hypothetical protein